MTEERIINRSNEYIGHPHEVDEGLNIYCERKAFQEGAKWADKDVTERACNLMCHTVCPHKWDGYDCSVNKCIQYLKFKEKLEKD